MVISRLPSPSVAISIQRPCRAVVKRPSTGALLFPSSSIGCGTVPPSCSMCSVTAIPAHVSGSTNSSFSTYTAPTPPRYSVSGSARQPVPQKWSFTTLTFTLKLLPLRKAPLARGAALQRRRQADCKAESFPSGPLPLSVGQALYKKPTTPLVTKLLRTYSSPQ